MSSFALQEIDGQPGRIDMLLQPVTVMESSPGPLYLLRCQIFRPQHFQYMTMGRLYRVRPKVITFFELMPEPPVSTIECPHERPFVFRSQQQGLIQVPGSVLPVPVAVFLYCKPVLFLIDR